MKRVLVIEPDIALGETYAQSLVAVDYDVTVVRSAEQAIQACDAQKPDVILLELQLQQHGGVEFLHEFRTYSEWQVIPVILLTFVPQTALAAYQESLDLLGVTAYAYKPATSLEKLRRLVAENMPKAQ